MSESEPAAPPQLDTWKCISCFRDNWNHNAQCVYCGVDKPVERETPKPAKQAGPRA